MKILFTRTVQLVALASLLHLVFAAPAHAYLDPGTASYTLQMLIAVVLSAAIVVKSYWRKLKSFLTGASSRQPKGDSQAKGAPPEEQAL